MRTWTREELVRMAGMHLYSEPEFRLQVLEVRTKTSERERWRMPRGSLIANVLKGQCIVLTDNGEFTLEAGHQIVFKAGESFVFTVAREEEPAFLQCIWMPGISGTES